MDVVEVNVVGHDAGFWAEKFLQHCHPRSLRNCPIVLLTIAMVTGLITETVFAPGMVR